MVSKKTVMAITLEIDKRLKKKILILQKKIYLKTGYSHYLKNNPNLHINLLSGQVSKKFRHQICNTKSFKINIKKEVKTNGIGFFLKKKLLIYLRYKRNLFIDSLRNKLKQKYKKNFVQVSATAKDDLRIPKTTFFFEQVKGQKFNQLLEIFKKEIFENLNFSSNKLLIFEINKQSEKVIGEIKLL